MTEKLQLGTVYANVPFHTNAPYYQVINTLLKQPFMLFSRKGTV